MFSFNCHFRSCDRDPVCGIVEHFLVFISINFRRLINKSFKLKCFLRGLFNWSQLWQIIIRETARIVRAGDYTFCREELRLKAKETEEKRYCLWTKYEVINLFGCCFFVCFNFILCVKKLKILKLISNETI